MWQLNGYPMEMMPEMSVDSVRFSDVEVITAALRDMATAGAVITPDDPAVGDVRDLMGLSRAEESTAATLTELVTDPPEPRPAAGGGGR